ncbi:flagellar protein FlaG [Oceanobacillus bengalensis]|uniref:Flagellar protein FlaG n=1 Tax=Oceanobacillus bengalensis TaxID=1435466 RepID=A0A494Z6N4_9BACI|nr:flagellar protein FlaG [Oceanobacillus bengalensis]RKQ18221.1 flagellar protein FlaG [Oceanobacillus bengalensis]
MGIDKLYVHGLPRGEYNLDRTSKTEKVTFENDRQHVVPLAKNENERIQKESVQEIVFSLNEFIKPTQTNLKYELHDELGEYYVTIVNSESNEVIKEIPEKKLLDMYAKMADFMGLLIDKKI